MLGSRQVKAQVEGCISDGCLDVLTVFTLEEARMGSVGNASKPDMPLLVSTFVATFSAGKASRRSRQWRGLTSQAADTTSRPLGGNVRDKGVTEVKTPSFGGDAA